MEQNTSYTAYFAQIGMIPHCPICSQPVPTIEEQEERTDGGLIVHLWLECQVCPNVLSIDLHLPYPISSELAAKQKAVIARAQQERADTSAAPTLGGLNMNVTHIRFFCTTHKCRLKNCGSGRVIYPTHGIVGDDYEDRGDKDGWLMLDASELYCPQGQTTDDDSNSCSDSWVIEGKAE